jgi:hypothetical protein
MIRDIIVVAVCPVVNIFAYFYSVTLIITIKALIILNYNIDLNKYDNLVSWQDSLRCFWRSIYYCKCQTFFPQHTVVVCVVLNFFIPLF